MISKKTSESLGIFWHGEEVDGFLMYGYCGNVAGSEPVFPLDSWKNDSIEWKSRKLFGEDWTVWMWEIRVFEWPSSTRWGELIMETLTAMIHAGAILAWCGLEGFFVEPPGLFKPTEMSGGIWAAVTADGLFFGPPPIDGTFEMISSVNLRELIRRIGLKPKSGL